MQTANPRHTKVFSVKGSLNHIQDMAVNTIAPIAKPSRREGHKCPSKCATIYLTDPKYSIDRGSPKRAMRKGLSFAHSYLN